MRSASKQRIHKTHTCKCAGREAPGSLPCDKSFHYAKHSQEFDEVMLVICNEEELCELDGAEPPEETVRKENSQKAKVKEAYLNVSQPHTPEPAKKQDVGLLTSLGFSVKIRIRPSINVGLKSGEWKGPIMTAPKNLDWDVETSTALHFSFL